MRSFSFDDPRVGQNDDEFLKITGTKERPQRIAYIPYEAHERDLVPSKELKLRAEAGDEDAKQKMEDIAILCDTIRTSLKKSVPSAHVWVNEANEKVVLYAKAEGAKTFWMDDIGFVYWKPGIPEDCFSEKGKPQIVYGMVVIEYEVDDEGMPRVIPPERHIHLATGHKLTFKYRMRPWSINKAKTNQWKGHTKNNPAITTDYMVWMDKSGKWDRIQFSPAGPAFWRKDPLVMQRIVKEARDVYARLPNMIAKDFTVQEIIDLSPQSKASSPGVDYAAQNPALKAEEIDFTDLLGTPSEEVASVPGAIENNPTQVGEDFPPVIDVDEYENILTNE